MSRRERELREIIKQADEQILTAAEATELAVERGMLAVGSALADEGYEPGIAMSYGEATDGWHPYVTNERGGTFRVVCATEVGGTAVWSAGEIRDMLQSASNEGLDYIPSTRE